MNLRLSNYFSTEMFVFSLNCKNCFAIEYCLRIPICQKNWHQKGEEPLWKCEHCRHLRSWESWISPLGSRSTLKNISFNSLGLILLGTILKLCQTLKHFELNRCKKMKLLPDSFGNLTNLQLQRIEEGLNYNTICGWSAQMLEWGAAKISKYSCQTNKRRRQTVDCYNSTATTLTQMELMLQHSQSHAQRREDADAWTRFLALKSLTKWQ